MAVLRAGGIDDAISEQLVMYVMSGTNSLANSLMIKVGTVSREHDFAGDSLISLRILSSVACSKSSVSPFLLSSPLLCPEPLDISCIPWSI